MNGSGEEAIVAAAHAIIRAESDEHVPRAVKALERIATSLEKIAAQTRRPQAEQQRLWDESLKSTTHIDWKNPGQCAGPCARVVNIRNTANTCYSCFCGDSPT